MHREAWEWLEHSHRLLRGRPTGYTLEIGSYNHNGSARDLFAPLASEYVGVDIIPGPGVDVVCNIANPKEFKKFVKDYGKFATIICTETLEHTPMEPLLRAMLDLLDTTAPYARLIITCAGYKRAKHSFDGGALKPGEWYQGVSVEEINSVIVQWLSERNLGDVTFYTDNSAMHRLRPEDTYYYFEIERNTEL
jgi:hypothetical protein